MRAEGVEVGPERPCLQLALVDGQVGTPPTKAVQTSVPPDVENSQVSEPSFS